ncbi:phage tail assembly chaperone [Olavius algarvensis spirochete endosymbiont]
MRNAAGLSVDNRTAWKTYRQTLRDVPQQTDFPENTT